MVTGIARSGPDPEPKLIIDGSNASIEAIKAALTAVAKANYLTSQIDGIDAPPASVQYLHSLTERGLADSYDYFHGTFRILINYADRVRYPTLKGVDWVELQYRQDTEGPSVVL